MANPPTVKVYPLTSVADDAAQIVDLVVSTIAPDTWQGLGASGTIRAFRRKDSSKIYLVVWQISDVHTLIDSVLRQVGVLT
jgi:hypothetical protein